MRSRRNFLKRAIAMAAGASALVQAAGSGAEDRAATPARRAPAASGAPACETRTTAGPPWAPVRVVDSDRIPWRAGGLGGSKTLFEDKESGSHLVILDITIGSPGALVHYHTFHEWAHWLSGDFTNNESTNPNEHMGPLQRYREGIFLDRPAYSLHGGERGREQFMQSQVGGSCLIMEEGEVASRTFSVEPTAPNYSPESKKVMHWAVPRIIDTIGGMPWEPDPSVAGLQYKFLVDDPSRGFRAMLWFLPGGWNSSQGPQFSRAYYYKQAHQFNFVLNGDLKLQAYKTAQEKAEKIAVAKYFLVERPPMSIFGLTEGVATERGCVWLEVTYGKGVTVSDTAIEEPIYV